jgi:ligand-binding sensor domain-containing protein
VLSVCQDAKGFLWLGTYDGLCRYDGSEFRLYKNDFFKKTGRLACINVVMEDSKGNIWMGTRGETLSRLDGRSGQLKEYNAPAPDITDILEDSAGTIWTASREGGICRVEGDSLRLFTKFPSVVRRISGYPGNGLIALVSNLSPFIINPKTNSVRQLLPDVITPPGVTEKNYFLGGHFKVDIPPGYGSVICYDFARRKRLSWPLPSNFHFDPNSNVCTVLKNGNIILLSDSSILEYNCSGKILSRIDIPGESEILNNSFINNIFEDNTGLIWLATNNGLLKIDRRKFLFRKMTASSPTRKIKYNYIRSLYTTANELWIGVKNGEIGRITMDTSNGIPLRQQWYSVKDISHDLGPPTIYNAHCTVNCLLKDSCGDIFAGGREGVLVLRQNGREFVRTDFWNRNKDLTPPEDLWSLCLDPKGRILAGMLKTGMYLLDGKTLRLTPCFLDGKRIDFSVWNIFVSSTGKIWVGTRKGLFYAKETADGKSYDIHPFFKGKDEFNGNRDVWGITEDRQGNMWFGSTGQGIMQLDTVSGRYRIYTMNDGLIDNVSCSLLADKSGDIWISTSNGLSEFNRKEEKFINFNEEDGLLSSAFNFKTACLSPWGEMYFGTKNGIASFIPENIRSPLLPDAPVMITDMKVMGVSYPLEGLADNQLQFSYNRNNISFRFALLEYSKTFTHLYRYMLRGFDKSWQYAPHDNPTAIYTNLPPGNYDFIVQASPDGKKWGTRQGTVRLEIQPAWWQRPLVWILSALLLATAVFLVIRRRIRYLLRREREQSRIQKTMAELEMKALRSQMNPHFIFNAMGAIQHYVLKNDIVLANEYLSSFAKLMRLFLESSRSKYIKLISELEMLKLYVSLEKLRFEEKFDYHFEIDRNLPAEKLEIPSMLLQPFIENAINHGLMHKAEKGSLEISFRYGKTADILLCTIEDDGVGRTEAARIRSKNSPGHTSMAMQILKERIKTFMESENLGIIVDIRDKFNAEGKAAGTIVEVFIPLKQDHESINHR